MTTRRELLRCLSGIVVVATSPALAQRRERVVRIAILDGADESSRAQLWGLFLGLTIPQSVLLRADEVIQ